MLRLTLVAGLLASSMLTTAPAEARDKTGAILGGAAVGLAAGAILGSALNQQPRPAPVYVQPSAPPPATVEYVEPAPRRVVVVDHFEDEASRLHMACDDGNRHACIRFGILIGQHRERIAQFRRAHPDYFSYED